MWIFSGCCSFLGPLLKRHRHASFCFPKWLLNSLFSVNRVWQQAWGLKDSCMFCENTWLIPLLRKRLVCSLDTGERRWKSPGQSSSCNCHQKNSTRPSPRNSLFRCSWTPAFFPFFVFSWCRLCPQCWRLRFWVLWCGNKKLLSLNVSSALKSEVWVSPAGKSWFSCSTYSFFQVVEASESGWVLSLQGTPCCSGRALLCNAW